MRRHGWTDMKLTVSLNRFANTPKKPRDNDDMTLHKLKSTTEYFTLNIKHIAVIVKDWSIYRTSG
jgi:hypothetical protein